MSAEVPLGQSAEHAFVALLENRRHKGLRRALFSVQVLLSEVLGGFFPEPASADVVIADRRTAAHLRRMAVDSVEGPGLLGRVHEDLAHLDAEAFRREWSV